MIKIFLRLINYFRVVLRCYVSVASYQGLIYAMGGFDGGQTRLKSAERYNPVSNQWSLIADMNHMRSDASATELNGYIFSKIILF